MALHEKVTRIHSGLCDQVRRSLPTLERIHRFLFNFHWTREGYYLPPKLIPSSAEELQCRVMQGLRHIDESSVRSCTSGSPQTSIQPYLPQGANPMMTRDAWFPTAYRIPWMTPASALIVSELGSINKRAWRVSIAIQCFSLPSAQQSAKLAGGQRSYPPRISTLSSHLVTVTHRDFLIVGRPWRRGVLGCVRDRRMLLWPAPPMPRAQTGLFGAQ